MRENKCAPPAPTPKPNLKNKDFFKWSRPEPCKQEDNIISSEWHERLQRAEPFVPVYDNAPLNMVYLLSGEYGRIWMKERDEWYAKVFIPPLKEKDMYDRIRKIRREAREAKKAAQAKIQERKERRAKEAELKAKLEAEKAEKLKAKIAKQHPHLRRRSLGSIKKKPQEKKKTESEAARKKPSNSQATSPAAPAGSTSPQETKSGDFRMKGWTPVELTLTCECAERRKMEEQKAEHSSKSTHSAAEPEKKTICTDYIKQLQQLQCSKTKEMFNAKDETREEDKRDVDATKDSTAPLKEPVKEPGKEREIIKETNMDLAKETQKESVKDSPGEESKESKDLKDSAKEGKESKEGKELKDVQKPLESGLNLAQSVEATGGKP